MDYKRLIEQQRIDEEQRLNARNNRPMSPLSDEEYANAQAEIVKPLTDAGIELPVIDINKPSMGLSKPASPKFDMRNEITTVEPQSSMDLLSALTAARPSLNKTDEILSSLSKAKPMAANPMSSTMDLKPVPEAESVNPANAADIERMDELKAKLNEPMTADDRLRNALKSNSKVNEIADWNELFAKFSASMTGGQNLGISDTIRKSGARDLEALEKVMTDEKAQKKSAQDALVFEEGRQTFALDKQAKELNLKGAQSELGVKEKEDDPSSDVSKGFRELLKVNLKRDIPESLSYSQAKGLFSSLSNLYTQELAISDRAKDRALSREEKAAKKADDTQLKEDIRKDKAFQEFRAELDKGNKGKELASYNSVNNLVSVLETAANSPTPFGDYATLLMGLKILQGDDSVVRGEEMKLGMQATSFANSVKNKINSIKDGTKLQPQQRQDILDLVKVLKDNKEKNFNRVIAPTLKDAKRRGLELDYIVPESVANDFNNLENQEKAPPSTKPSWAK